MNEKESKVPIYIATLVALILVAASVYFVIAPKPKAETTTNISTNVQTTAISTTIRDCRKSS